MEKYIIELISENNRVIIPNFGAFIVSKEHGTSVLFNNFLSFNDGLLVNYIAEQKGIDTIIATEQVFEYADNLKKQLEEVGTYTFNKLGTFTKDDNGILRFQQADDVAELFGQDATMSNEASTEISDKEENLSENNVLLLDIDNEDEQVKTPPIESDRSKKEELKSTVVEHKFQKNTPPEVLITPPPGIKPENKNVDTEKVQLKKNVPTPSKPKKKNNAPILFLIAIGIIIIFFGVYFLFYKKAKEPEPKVIKKAVLKPAVQSEVAKDTTYTVTNIGKPAPINPVPQKGVIYIIVGGFKNLDNAQNMVARLKSEGNSNAQTFELNNMHLVSIDSDTSYRKMEARQQEILNNMMESWLYQVK